MNDVMVVESSGKNGEKISPTYATELRLSLSVYRQRSWGGQAKLA